MTNHALSPVLPTVKQSPCTPASGAGLKSQPYTAAKAFEQFVRLTVADGAASERTVKSYTASLRLYFLWAGLRGLETLTAKEIDIQSYRAHLTKSYKRGTVKIYLRAVRLFYDLLQRSGRRTDNPAAGVFAPKERTTEEQRIIEKALTVKEAARLVYLLPKAITPAGARDKAIILLMLLQGLRANEVCYLMLDYLDASFTRLQVFGKGSKVRTVVLAPEVRQALMDWMDFRNRKDDYELQTPLFISFESPTRLHPTMEMLSVRTIERIADKYLQFAGLKKPGRSAHALRHTYAMLAILGGAERERVGVSMGHSNLGTTDLYIRAAATFQANPADAVSKIIKNGGIHHG